MEENDGGGKDQDPTSNFTVKEGEVCYRNARPVYTGSESDAFASAYEDQEDSPGNRPIDNALEKKDDRATKRRRGRPGSSFFGGAVAEYPFRAACERK